MMSHLLYIWVYKKYIYSTVRRAATRRRRSHAEATKDRTPLRSGRQPGSGHIRRAYRARRCLRHAICGCGGTRCSGSARPSSGRAAPDARSRSPCAASTTSEKRPARYPRRGCGREPNGKPGCTTSRNAPKRIAGNRPNERPVSPSSQIRAIRTTAVFRIHFQIYKNSFTSGSFSGK